MLTHRWVTRIFLLLLPFSVLFTSGQRNPYNCFSAPLPYYPSPFPRCFPCIPTNQTCPPPTNSTNCSLIGNDVFLVVDPITRSLAVQIIPPVGCSNATNPNSTNPGNGTNPGGGGGGGTGTCSLITLITQLIQSLLELLNSLLTGLLTSLLQLLRNLLQSLLGPLLNGLLGDLNKLLNNTLTSTLGGLGNLVNSTLGGLGGGNSPLGGLLNSVQGLPLTSALPTGPLSAVTNLIEELINGLLNSINNLLKNLLDPSSGQALLPALTQNITELLNNTLTGVLDDVDKLVNDLLNDLLSNSSLTGNLTHNIEVLLTDVLNDTLCDVEKLLNDTGSLAAVISDVQKLLDDLLNDILQDLGKTIDDLLTNLLTKGGLLDDLLSNIEKLVTDLLKNLLNQKINDMKKDPLMNPNVTSAMMQNFSNNLADACGNFSFPTPPIPLPPGIPLPPPGIPNPITNPSQPIPLPSPTDGILKLVNDTVNGLLNGLRNLLNSLEDPSGNATSPIVQGPVSSLLDSLNKLLQNLLNSLLGDIRKLVDNKLGNITGALGLQNITGPVGTLVTGLLKDILGCNLTCTNNTAPSRGPNGTIPLPTPLPCDPSCFTELLDLYREAITCSLKTDAPSVGRIVDSYVCGNQNDDYYDDENYVEELPSQLLQGVDKTVELTNTLASRALPTFVHCTVQNTNDRSGLEVVLPIE